MGIPKYSKGTGRINRYGFGVTIYSENDMWWYVDGHGWMKHEDIPKELSYGSHFGSCKTLRAFFRHVRKHCGHIKNAEIVWCQMHGSDYSVHV